MASFSTSGFVAAANGSTTVTIGPIGTSPPVPFSTTIQTTKASTAGGATQVVAQQQHIFHQSLAHQQARHSLATAAAPAGSPPTGQSTSQQTQQQQQNTMQQAFQVRNFKHLIVCVCPLLLTMYVSIANDCWSSWPRCPAISAIEGGRCPFIFGSGQIQVWQSTSGL